ncbi:MAG: cysteine synthase A [Clostridia bacterium]|nr:cysteine synthase A [Clostridia bacterium]
MKIFESMTELIGKTPLMRVGWLSERANILAKLECMNPAGSAKDRPAMEMIEDYEKRGLLKAGGTVIEPTSGNTGIALAAICAARGYKAVFVLPDTMSIERIKLLKAYGAQVVLTPGAEGMSGSVKKAEEICAATPGAIIAGQFVNPSNPLAHEKTTGPEIWADTDGNVAAFVAGVGTGGTITGTGHYLKKMDPEVKIIGVEPEKSPLISQGRAGAHGLMGIGANFIPDALDKNVIDDIILISESEAYEYARRMAREQGILVGITSGAALCAAKKLADSGKFDGKNIVALLPDGGERYLSTALYEGNE